MRYHVRGPNCVVGACERIRAPSIVEPHLLGTLFRAAAMPFTLVPLAASHFAGKSLMDKYFTCTYHQNHYYLTLMVSGSDPTCQTFRPVHDSEHVKIDIYSASHIDIEKLPINTCRLTRSRLQIILLN